MSSSPARPPAHPYPTLVDLTTNVMQQDATAETTPSTDQRLPQVSVRWEDEIVTNHQPPTGGRPSVQARARPQVRFANPGPGWSSEKRRKRVLQPLKPNGALRPRKVVRRRDTEGQARRRPTRPREESAPTPATYDTMQDPWFWESFHQNAQRNDRTREVPSEF